MLMRDFNNITITGRIDGEIRFDEEKSQLTFGLRSYFAEGKYHAWGFVTIIMFGARARYMVDKLFTGMRYFIVGRLASYKNEKGRNTHIVTAEQIHKLTGDWIEEKTEDEEVVAF